MLQSTVNLLGSTSTVWNTQNLKRIFRISEDHLKILANIPGWTTKADSDQSSPSLTAVINKDNYIQQTSSIAAPSASTSDKRDLLVDFKVSEKHSEDNIRKERFPLRKSSSLDSISVQKTTPSPQTLKCSSSTSNITEEASAVKTFSFNVHKLDLGNRAISTEKTSKIEIEEIQIDMDHHSKFSNSGVQCKMSQDLNVELNDFQTNASVSLPSSNFSVRRESLKLLNAFSTTSQTSEKEPIDKLRKNDCLGGAGPSKENLPEKSKVDDDESYISQPVPCAQPLPESMNPEKGLFTHQKESTHSQNNNFSSISKNVQSPLDKTSSDLPGKRKRKSRTEKSKKFKGVNSEDIKIEYSSKQIKNMIELIKVLNKY